MLWQKMLTRQGYDVAVRNHPHEALEELKNNPLRYSLVISDLAMPDMTGDQLCAEMTKINPRVPMILCTGYLEEMKTTRLCPAVKRRILKPVNLLMLAETVRSVIDHPDECSSPSEH
jgi:DNA-binding NtrC family response regulator